MGYDNDHFDDEQRPPNEHGMFIVFQLYRLNVRATTLEELRGQKLAEVQVHGGFVSGIDTVAAVKERVLALFEENSRAACKSGTPVDLGITEVERVTLFFGGRPMQDDKRFYADHFMLLPAGVQVCLHACERQDLTELIRKLSDTSRARL